MLGSYVCRQCRSRLTRRIAPARNLQWQPRATFLSLRQTQSQDDAEHAQPEELPKEPKTPKSTGGEVQNIAKIRYVETGDSTQPNFGGRYSKLIEEAAEDQEQRLGTEQFNVTETAPDTASENGPAVAIQKALREHKVEKAYRVFLDNYKSRSSPVLTHPPPSDIALVQNGAIFHELLKEVNVAFCFRTKKIGVTPTQVLFRYEQTGIATHELWIKNTLLYLTHQALLAINTPSPTSGRNLTNILTELVSLWRLFFQIKGPGTADRFNKIDKKWNFPTVDELPKVFNTPNFNMRLQEFIPNQMGNSMLGFCAVYFYTLSDAFTAIKPLRDEAAPFIQFLGRLLAGSSVRSVFIFTKTSRQFNDLPDEVKQDVIKEMENAPIRALTDLGSQGESLQHDQTDDPIANLESFHLKRIARAVELKDTADTLENIWIDVEKTFTTDNISKIPHTIYNAFLSGFMILFRAQRSVDVWNHMVAHGVKPDMKSWVALLEGCKKAKDLDGFNAMWARLLNTGVEPDNYAWTTRVHGLCSLRQINLALTTLDDMGKRWLSAENLPTDPRIDSRNRSTTKKQKPLTKITNTCTKPSIEVINGAVTAIVQLPANAMRHDKRIDYVRKILAWAGNFSIKPDAITFNSLIQLHLRAADYATAYKILRQMEINGIVGDVATYTMLIRSSFDNNSFDTLTKAQQADKILNLFNDLEADGLKLNQVFYGIAIDRLLKQYSNHDAVRQIMGHMRERNIIPSAHLYASLITHYFQQSPPAIEAVDYLVDQFFTGNRVATDRFLFDRIIEGYAAHGEVGKMMSVVTRLSKHGAVPGWIALTTVIQVLAKEGDFDRARAIVRDVEMREGIAKGGVLGGNKAEDRFFSVVKEIGLGSREERMAEYDNDTTMNAGEDQMMGEYLRGQDIDPKVVTEETRE
ncbi:hypothetical protein GQ44DRAFT_58218 [Phaeosphaeriaceae sp. PMI808]|nr:hypothetical protein GQ44DRAFT_58218 [Phaeosphaeriaceae sp. PMI808]